MAYKAFISYSHAADDRLAPALHAALHRFARPFYKLRALRVFRDKSSLQVTPKLWSLIQEALAASEYFLLMASPAAAKSHWVQKEVAEWLKLRNGSADKILLIVTEGEVVWDSTTNDFDWERTTALPSNLRGVFQHEPLYSDLRWARTSIDLSLRNPRFLDAVGTLGATLHGKPKDEMVGDDVRQHRLFKSASAAVAVLLIGLTVVAIRTAFYAARQRDEAVQERNIATSRELASAALAQLPSNPELGLLLAIEAAKRGPLAETENTLRQVLAKSPIHVLRTNRTESASNQTATFGQDGKLVVMTNDKTVWAFDLHNGRMLFERTFDLFVVNAVTGPDGRFIAIMLDTVPVTNNEPAKRAGTVQICEARTGREVAKLQASYPGADLIFSPDGKLLVTPGDRSQVWEAGTWRAIAFIDGRAATFNHDGRLILTKSADDRDNLFITDAMNWKRVAEIPSAKESVDGPTFGAFSVDGKHVISKTNDGRVRLDSLGGRRTVREVKFNGSEGATLPQFSPNGRVVAFAIDRKAVIWDLTSGETRELSEMTNALNALSFSPDSRFVLTVGNSAWIHSMHSGKILGDFHAIGNGAVTAAEFSPDGRYFLTTNDDGSVFIGNLDFDTARLILEAGANTGTTYTESATFSPDRKFVATITTTDDGRYVGQVWELGSGRIIRLLTHPVNLNSVAFSPDSRLLLTTSDESAQVWEPSSGRKISELLHGERLVGAVYSPDGKLIATTGKGSVKIWDSSAGWFIREIRAEVEMTDGPATFSPDSKRILITAAGLTRIWEVYGDRAVIEMGERREIGGITDAVYRQDGKYILTWTTSAGLFNTSRVQVRDANSGRIIVELDGHVGSVLSAAFDPTGEYILTTSGFDSGGDEKAIPPPGANETRVWDLKTGSAFYQFRDPDEPMLSGAFASDGKTILVVGASGRVFSYSCDLCVPQDELLRLAQKRSVRQLTPDERVRYLHQARN